MSKIIDKDLEIKYAGYRKRVKEVMKKQKETQARSIMIVALELRVTSQTIRNAMTGKIRRITTKVEE